MIINPLLLTNPTNPSNQRYIHFNGNFNNGEAIYINVNGSFKHSLQWLMSPKV